MTQKKPYIAKYVLHVDLNKYESWLTQNKGYATGFAMAMATVNCAPSSRQ